MRRLSRSAAVVGVATLLITGGSAYALAASSSAGKITVCIRHAGGALYKAKKCARHDKKLTWNVTATGRAGGALSGSYPDPSLASGVITDANVRPDSLTGTSINASTLGTVPAASTADTATTADAPGTLPGGSTERGAFNVEAQAPAGSAFWGNAYSFPFPLSGTVSATYMAPGASPTAACPGTVTDPEAAAGDLCLYAHAALNVSQVGIADPTTSAGGQASPYGFFVQIESSSAGLAYAFGTWAVTAP